jgi:hypothetical protein
MSASVAIPLHPIPSGVNSPQTLPHTSSSGTSRSAVASPQPPNSSQAANSTNQAKPTILAARASLSTSLCSCTSWIKSHPLLSIGGLIVGLITLFVGYHEAQAANHLTWEGNGIAGTALDYTRYLTWCPNRNIGFPYI